MICNIQKLDIGTIFRVTIIDCETKLPIDLSSATEMKIKFFLPDKSVIEKTAVFTTSGIDGKIEYITVANDLSIAGRWKIQGYVVDSGYTNSSSVEEFIVSDNLN